LSALIKSSRSIFYRNITVSGICLFRLVDLKEAMMNMNLFKRDNARKKWHKKAWMINPNKTKLILVATAGPKRKHVPPWIFRELNTSIQDMYAMSKVRMQHCSPYGCPASNITETSSSTDEGTLRF
jgi:hypothetical protein